MKDKPAPRPLAVDINTGAQVVGMSRSQFYRVFLDTGRVKTMKTGKRDRTIDYAELETAYTAYRAELMQTGANATA